MFCSFEETGRDDADDTQESPDAGGSAIPPPPPSRGRARKPHGFYVEDSSEEENGTDYRKKRRVSSFSQAQPKKKGRPSKKPKFHTHFPGYPADVPILGYKKSYAGLFKVPEIKRGPRERWSKPAKPIISKKHVPKGWHDREPDLDPK